MRFLLPTLLLGLVVARAGAADLFTGEAAVIARLRAQSNSAIAAHNAGAVVSFLTEDVHVTAGSGAGLEGRAAVRKKFAEQFGKLTGLIYVLTPRQIELSTTLPLAAEHGTWIGRWTEAGQPVELHGSYMAMWRKEGSSWLIRAELFVTLGRVPDKASVPKPGTPEPAVASATRRSP